MNLVEILTPYGDSKYKAFNERIVPSNYPRLGVRLPQLRLISLKYSYQDFANYKPVYFEEVMVLGLVIGKIKEPELLRKALFEFIPYIDNWSLVDSVVCGFKSVKKNLDFFYSVILELLEMPDEFSLRVGIILGLSFYMKTSYLPILMKKYSKIKADFYYVKMALAWFFSVSYLHDSKFTLKCLENCDDWTYNKAIQKMLESYRITGEEKEILRGLKRIRSEKK